MIDSKKKRCNTYAGYRPTEGPLLVLVNGKELLPDRSQKVWTHSPDGFEWGYGGSGPAQLALAICLHEFNDPMLAQGVYQEFKRAFVAGWSQEPGSGWTLTSQQIDEWLSTHETQHAPGPRPATGNE